MRSLIRKAFATLLVFASSAVLANPVWVQVSELRSAKTNGVYRLRISPTLGGKLRVTVDPNVCGNPGPCTKMAISSEVVEPKIIEDNRPVDGNLLLNLTSAINLSIGSGDNLDNHVAITAIVINADGTNTNFPMSSEISVQVVK